MPKENFPYEAIAVLGRVLEENSGKYAPGHWRQVSMIEHKDHAKKHLDNLRNWPNISFFAEDDLANAFVRLAMAVAVRECESVKSMSGFHKIDFDHEIVGLASDGEHLWCKLHCNCSELWHDDWF